MNKQTLIQLRMERQGLIHPLNSYEEYLDLFRTIQPVTPIYFSAPGDPPSLVHRTTFADQKYTDQLRSIRKIIKGRFQNGNVGYVYFDDIELYIAAYKKDFDLEFKHDYILKLLRQEGPLTIHQMKEISGMLAKEITPILHDLQKAFIVYEDQIDSDLERGWYIFESEFNVNIDRYEREYAVSELIKKSLHLLVFADFQMLKGWLRLPSKIIKDCLNKLIHSNIIKEYTVEGDLGYSLITDIEYLREANVPTCTSVYVIHRSDFLVKAYEHILKETFKDYEVLQYILIDGEFKGAVCGHWRIGPHDVEDIVLILPEEEKNARKAEIISAVKQFYQEPFSKIIKYDGQVL